MVLTDGSWDRDSTLKMGKGGRSGAYVSLEQLGALFQQKMVWHCILIHRRFVGGGHWLLRHVGRYPERGRTCLCSFANEDLRRFSIWHFPADIRSVPLEPSL